MTRRAGPGGHDPLVTDVVADAAADIVVKIGGAVLDDAEALAHALAALDRLVPGVLPGGARVLIVPGGGPFADTVRELDHRLAMGDDAAHWMAILAMDQFAHLLVARAPRTRLATDAVGAAAALAAGHVPVLAPYDWMRRADPLPHSWSVTSDSIALWIAAAVGARRLVLVKPIDGPVEMVADAHVPHLLADCQRAGAPIEVQVCRADALVATVAALGPTAAERPRSGPPPSTGVSPSGTCTGGSSGRPVSVSASGAEESTGGRALAAVDASERAPVIAGAKETTHRWDIR